MAIESFVVEARTHGRWLLRAPLRSPAAAGILVGFHGYMENAERHLAELERIPGLEDWALAAVDALHAFYARGDGSGRVVRGWMTRDLREEAIEDNVRYVRGVFDALRARFGWRVPVAVVGFSQGASMAWRAALLAGKAGLLSGVTGRTAIDGGLRLEFGPGTDAGELARLAAAEQGCCRFFSFAVVIDGRGLALEVSAPGEAADVVTALFGAPDR